MDYKALFSGLIGTLIGAAVSITTLFVQGHYQEKRETTRLIFEMAFKDYELRFLHATENTPQRTSFPVILAYHRKMVDLLEHGRLTPESAEEIVKSQSEMTDALYRAVQTLPPPSTGRAEAPRR